MARGKADIVAELGLGCRARTTKLILTHAHIHTDLYHLDGFLFHLAIGRGRGITSLSALIITRGSETALLSIRKLYTMRRPCLLSWKKKSNSTFSPVIPGIFDVHFLFLRDFDSLHIRKTTTFPGLPAHLNDQHSDEIGVNPIRTMRPKHIQILQF
jgi:hypothetical protein